MGSGIVGGLNWSIEGGVFSIFGQRGYVDGKKWAVPSGFGPALTKVNPDPVSGHILRIIAGDKRDGNEGKIAYVGVNPFVGLLLALEEVITSAILRAAIETPHSIDLNVTLGGVKRRVVILKDATHTMATYDRKNQIV